MPINTPATNSLLTIREAAKKLNVSIKTLRRWENHGLVHPTRNLLNQRLYSETELDNLHNRKYKPLPQDEISPQNYHSISEAADEIGVSVKTLRRWDNEGKIDLPRDQLNRRIFTTETINHIKTTRPSYGSTHTVPVATDTSPKDISKKSITQSSIPKAFRFILPAALTPLLSLLPFILVTLPIFIFSLLGYKPSLPLDSLNVSSGLYNNENLTLQPLDPTASSSGSQYVNPLLTRLQRGEVAGITVSGGSLISFENILDDNFNFGVAGLVEGSQLVSTTTVKAPLIVASQEKVINLNADLLDGHSWEEISLTATNSATTVSAATLQDAYNGGNTILTTSGRELSISGSGGVNIASLTTITNDLALNGGNLTTTQSTANLFNTTATTVNIGGSATSLNLGASTGTTSIKNTLSLAGAITSNNTIEIKPSNDSDDYIYFSTSSNQPGLFFAGATSSNDPGLRVNSSTGRIEFRDQGSVTWQGLGTGSSSNVLTDGGTYVYPTNRESIRIYDATGADYIDIAHNGTNVIITSAGTSRVTLDTGLTIAGTVNLSNVAVGTDNQILSINSTTGLVSYLDSTNWDKDSTNDLTTGVSFSGDVSGLYSNLLLGNDVVTESKLAIVNGPTNGYILQTDGSGILSWSDPAVLTASANYWDLTDQQVHPKNALWHDLLIGGISTASATISLQANTGALSVASGFFQVNNLGQITAPTNNTINGISINSGTISTATWQGNIVGNQYGGTGLDTSLASNGQLLIGNGSGFSLGSLTGTTNQVTVTPTAGTITLSLPQDIHTGASPTFAGLTVGHILPITNATYDLGTSTNRFRDLYLSGSSLHLGIDGNEALIKYDPISDFLAFNPSSDGTPELILHDDGNLEISGSASVSALYIGGDLINATATELNLLSGITSFANWDQNVADDLTLADITNASLWQLTNEQIYPKNTLWHDLLLGGNSTASSTISLQANTGAITANSIDLDLLYLNGQHVNSNAAELNLLSGIGSFNTWDMNLWDDITFSNLGTASASILSGWDQDSSNDLITADIGVTVQGYNPNTSFLGQTIEESELNITNGYIDGHLLSVDGSGNMTWVDPGSFGGTISLWENTNEQLYSKNALWNDLLIGGTSTASASIALQANTGNIKLSSINTNISSTELALLDGRTGTLLDTNNIVTQLSAWDQDASNDLITTDIGVTVQGYNANTSFLGSTIDTSELDAASFNTWDMNIWDDLTFSNLGTAAASILSAWDQNAADDLTLTDVTNASLWQLTNQQVSLKNSTLDLILGGTSTTSASIALQAATGNGFYTGNLGIGTTNLVATLNVGQPGTTSTFTDGFEDGTLDPFTTSGDANWTVQSSTVNQGSYAAQAGAITDNQKTTLTLTQTLSNASEISFYVSTSSESNYDILTFYIDNIRQNEWSGSTSWRNFRTRVPSGTHTFTWVYMKETVSSSGADTAYIDDITIYTQPASSLFAGNIGIGTTNPIHTIDAIGNINTTGSFLINGRNALSMNITDIFIGHEAGKNSGGGGNIGIGYRSGTALAGGSMNTFVGYGSGRSTTTGNNNSFFGVDSGRNNTIGNNNVFIGAQSGYYITEGSNNTALGIVSNQRLTTGLYNTSIGSSAGFYTTTGNYNTSLGHGAGFNNISGNFNLALGRNASRTSPSNLINSIAIGSEATPSANHQLVIGSDAHDLTYISEGYFGSGVTSTNPRDFSLMSSGGKGTDIGGANLILGAGKATGNAAGGNLIFKTSDVLVSGTTLQSLTEKMRLTTNGDLGIGTTNPGYKLQVVGDIDVTTGNTYRLAGADVGQYLIDSAGSNGNVWMSDGSGRGGWSDTLTWDQNVWDDITTTNLATQAASILSGWDQNASDDLTTSTSFSGDVTGLYNNLQLGTGVVGSTEISNGSVAEVDLNITNSPSAGYVLQVDGSGNMTWTDPGTSTTNYWTQTNEQISPKNALWHDLLIGGTSTASASIALQANTGNIKLSSINTDISATELALLNNRSGTLLDTNNVATQLSGWDQNAADDYVSPLTNQGDILYGGAAGVATRLAGSTTNGHVLKYNTATNLPYWSTDIDTNTTYTASNGLTLATTNFKLGGTLAETTTITQGNYDMVYNLTGTGDFNIQDNGTSAFFVRDNANVGIGTTNPGYKLEVAGGDLNLTTGALRIAGADVSQYFITSAGNNGEVWKSDGAGAGVWGTDVGFANPLTTQGDILYGGASGTPTRLAGSTTNGYVLKYNTGTNTPYWDVDGGGTSYTASNGLTLNGTAFELGGTLNRTTTVTQGNYDMVYNLTGTGDFNIQDNGTSAFFVKDDGNVGIGTTDPAYRLDVNGYLGVSGGIAASQILSPISSLELSNVSDNSHISLAENYISYNALQHRFTDGNVGIGTTAPRSSLDVLGDSTINIGRGLNGDPLPNIIFNAYSGGTTRKAILQFTNTGTLGIRDGLNAIDQLTLGRSPSSSNVGYVGTDTSYIQIGTTGKKISLGVATTLLPQNTVDVGGNLAVGTYAGNNAAPANSIIVSGSIGIGTTNPGYKLQVAGDIDVTSGNTYRLAGIDMGQYFIDAAGTSGQVWTSDGSGRGVWATAALNLFQLNNQQLSPINALFHDILVGGTSTASATIALQANTGKITAKNLDINNGNSLFSVTNTAITSSLPHSFTAAGDVSFAYDAIFTNDTTSKIQSYGPFSIEAGDSYESNNLTLNTYNYGDIVLENITNGPIATFKGTGNVGIGTTSPARALHVQIATDAPPVRFQDSNGYCEINPTSTTWTCTSDIRLKKDIESITKVDALKVINDLNPVTFLWNKEKPGDTKHLGFIAQEVERILPDLVTTDETGLKAVSYGSFVPLLAAALKEQQVEINTVSKLRLTDAGNVATTSAKLTTLETNTSSLTGKFSLLSTNVTTQSNFLSDLVATVTNLFTRTSAVETKTNLLEATVSDLKSQVATISAESLSPKDQALTTDIATISARIALLEQQVTNQPAPTPLAVATVAGAIDDLSTTVNQLSSDFQLLSSNVDLALELTASQSALIDSLIASAAAIPASNFNLLTSDLNLDVESIFVSDFFSVLGDSVLTNLTVTNHLTTSSIESLDGNLSLIAGLVTLDGAGSLVTINGDLFVTGVLSAPVIDEMSLQLASLSAQLTDLSSDFQLLSSDNASLSAQVASLSAQIASPSAAIATPSALVPQSPSDVGTPTPSNRLTTLGQVSP